LYAKLALFTKLNYCPSLAGPDMHHMALGQWHCCHDGYKSRLSGISVGTIHRHGGRKSRLSGVSVGTISRHQVVFI